MIEGSGLLIADLTFGNRNVYHEIGYLMGLIISPASNSIAWLAVSRATRGVGLGRGLLSAGVADLDPNKPIFVQTFAPVSPAGATARQLYSAFGFTDHEPKEPTPAGVPTILMRKPAGSDRG